MLSNAKLKEEIVATEEAIKKLVEIIKQCEYGIEKNNIVLKAFQEALK